MTARMRRGMDDARLVKKFGRARSPFHLAITRIHSSSAVRTQTHLVDAVVRQLPREPRADVLNGVQVRALRWSRQRYDLPNKKIIIRLLPVNFN